MHLSSAFNEPTSKEIYGTVNSGLGLTHTQARDRTEVQLKHPLTSIEKGALFVPSNSLKTTRRAYSCRMIPRRSRRRLVFSHAIPPSAAGAELHCSRGGALRLVNSSSACSTKHRGSADAPDSARARPAIAGASFSIGHSIVKSAALTSPSSSSSASSIRSLRPLTRSGSSPVAAAHDDCPRFCIAIQLYSARVYSRALYRIQPTVHTIQPYTPILWIPCSSWGSSLLAVWLGGCTPPVRREKT